MRPCAPTLARPLVALVAIAGCMPSQQDVQTAQTLDDMAQAFSDMRVLHQDQADRIDSLVSVVAKQDSILRTLANLAGVAVR